MSKASDRRDAEAARDLEADTQDTQTPAAAPTEVPTEAPPVYSIYQAFADLCDCIGQPNAHKTASEIKARYLADHPLG